MTYQLAIPPLLSGLHDVFHISQLRKYIPYYFQPIIPDTVEVRVDISFQPIHIRSVDYTINTLRNKEIPLVKVLREASHPGEATWELASEMRVNYPHLFR